ncbi:MAG: EamA family transporter [Tabrizicola sp.]|uniref:aromatic amino acid exporter YddG n=1 Tax=Tabrizicola sp. TaxID=2005166 RepID=UPI002733C762|nr:EamA family transporter [Tabrizicola sp.]MDP3262153.1 EamA family transporter [Tabrizicola sp.]MDP3648101.1 EamA family transporter [Paracoccaceae bacterium]MDZ4066975.1 EamA family transporter [Tabrizicola sp.]
MTRTKATTIGFTAVLMWSLLALFTIGSAPVPPFQLNAMCFAIGGLIGLAWTARAGFGVLRAVSWKVYAFGTLGLFGYHFLYFTAFRLAPTAETGLIAYLWPLFIVLLSGLLPGERLTGQHVLGAVVAFAGAAVIVLARGGEDEGSALGLGLAFLCALTWAGYSVVSRGLGAVPTESVTVFCLATAGLSVVAHLALEETVWPTGVLGWGAVLALGVGPVGAAFFTWDIGMKRGDIQLLGVASYAAPLLSTLALVAAGITAPSYAIGIAAVLIAGGAALAARASAKKA